MLEDLRSQKPKSFFNHDVLFADAAAIIIGGTGTIAALLSYSFYELAKDPSRQPTLREAVASSYGTQIPGQFSDKGLEAVDYLNAFINEALRMYTPVCNNGQRTTPPEGIVVDGTFIPGGTQVTVPVHSIQRCMSLLMENLAPISWLGVTDSKFYEQSNEFIIERWTTRPELILEKRAFHPFLIGRSSPRVRSTEPLSKSHTTYHDNVGPYNCVGKRLALCLVRQVLASTVWYYDFNFAPGETGNDIHEKAVNQMILKAGPLSCTFSLRQDVVLDK